MNRENDENELVNALSHTKSIYLLPRDKAASEVISPAFAHADKVAIMMGFFSSASFSEIAPGLAEYLQSSNEVMRLIISPFINAHDQKALLNGTENLGSMAESAFKEMIPDADELSGHTLSCLAWLISQGRLEIKIAVMKDALFHSKVWLFEKGNKFAAFHGSANMTGLGLGKNREQLTLSKSWKSDEGAEVYHELATEFEMLWSGGDRDCVTVPLSKALKDKIVKEFKGEHQPTEEDFLKLWRKSHGLEESVTDIDDLIFAEKSRSFIIPDWLEYKTGDYAHQGKAINEWKSRNYRGILEMCTGSGKTLTSMIGAHQLYSELGSLLIIVSAPYDVLINQWCEEIELFGIKPSNMSKCVGPKGRAREIANSRRKLRRGVSTVEAIVVSNDTLCTGDFIDLISEHKGPKLLVADECHNLGAESFINNPPETIEYRLGLSATPIRQYDEEGTDALFAFFGEPCFQYTLEEAIGVCLTQYDYHVHFVELQTDEMEDWREISAKIGKLSWKMKAGVKDKYLENLFLQRRRILETAEGKLDKLDDLISQENKRLLNYTLIYATDKDPNQLDDVNALLSDKGIMYHQLTASETSNSKKSSKILDQFQSGTLQVLTAKKVLDEGVNIPQIMRAYILASTTVKRQWVQRRGRLLRTCKEIGKDKAIIHDFVALPPGASSGDDIDNEAKKIVNSELDRVWEFARLSQNGAETGGPFKAVEHLRSLVGG